MEIMFAILVSAFAVGVVVILCARRAECRAEETQRTVDRLDAALGALGGMFAQQGQAVARSMLAEEERTDRLRAQVEQRLGAMSQQLEAQRMTMDLRAEAMQKDNAQRLEAMRQTVDEKLQKTLDDKLNQSFAQVSQRLEAVYRGLGEMQSLAAGVGDLKKVLTNVKTRGTWGEIQLAALLEQMLAPGQYERGAQVKKGSQERVDFAVRMPGGGEEEVLLPIDAKFPQEDYARLMDAYDAGDAAQVAAQAKALGEAIKVQARSIRDKYINPPLTTDFAILYLPVEGLYAETLRQEGLVEQLQRDYRVTVSGPTTLCALLTSLQMGFRTLAIEKRSAEVWQLLGAVKTDFGRFAQTLEKTQRALSTAANSIEDATRKTRTIERRLRSVEEMPEEDARELLGTGTDEETW